VTDVRIRAHGAVHPVRDASYRGNIVNMNAQRTRSRSTHDVKQDERSSGVSLVPATGRVARRGSTRTLPSDPAESASRGRGRRRHGE
jgi:hypothetical protein